MVTFFFFFNGGNKVETKAHANIKSEKGKISSFTLQYSEGEYSRNIPKYENYIVSAHRFVTFKINNAS